MNKGYLLEQDGLAIKPKPITTDRAIRVPYKGPETQPFKRFVKKHIHPDIADRLPKGHKRHDLYLKAPDGREYAFRVKGFESWFDRLIPPNQSTEYGTYGTNKCNTLETPRTTPPTWDTYFHDCLLSGTMEKFSLLQDKDENGNWLLPHALVYKDKAGGVVYVRTWKIQCVNVLGRNLGKLPKIDKAPEYHANTEHTPKEIARALRVADQLCPIPPKYEAKPHEKTYEWGHRKHNGTKDVVVCRH